MYCALILRLLEHNSFKKNSSGIRNKVNHENYGEASNILDLIWLLSQKAPVYSLERKRTAIENVNQRG